MKGPRENVIPDNVQVDITNYIKTLAKLEKVFSDLPAPKKLASMV